MRVDVNSYLSTIDIDKIISEADKESIWCCKIKIEKK
jgi:hypothetical protein